MLEKIRKLFNADELLSGNYGIEREALRVDYNGLLAQSKHPEVFGDKNVNPYITTDFSESQIEVITPVFNNVEDNTKSYTMRYFVTSMDHTLSANEIENFHKTVIATFEKNNIYLKSE